MVVENLAYALALRNGFKASLLGLTVAQGDKDLLAALRLNELQGCSDLNLDYLEVCEHVALLMHCLAALGALLLDISDVLVPDLKNQLLEHSLEGLCVHGLVNLDLELSFYVVV